MSDLSDRQKVLLVVSEVIFVLGWIAFSVSMGLAWGVPFGIGGLLVMGVAIACIAIAQAVSDNDTVGCTTTGFIILSIVWGVVALITVSICLIDTRMGRGWGLALAFTLWMIFSASYINVIRMLNILK